MKIAEINVNINRNLVFPRYNIREVDSIMFGLVSNSLMAT